VSVIIDSYFEDDETLPDMIRDLAPEQTRLDRELMLRACQTIARDLERLAGQFQESREFVEATGVSNGYALWWFPKAAQYLYPDLVVKAISNLADNDEDDVNQSVGDVAETLWANLDVAEAWFFAAGDFHDHFPDAIQDNQEFGLLVAEYPWLDFEHATSVALRSDKEFMLSFIMP
jgi:hypothetical protein